MLIDTAGHTKNPDNLNNSEHTEPPKSYNNNESLEICKITDDQINGNVVLQPRIERNPDKHSNIRSRRRRNYFSASTDNCKDNIV